MIISFSAEAIHRKDPIARERKQAQTWPNRYPGRLRSRKNHQAFSPQRPDKPAKVNLSVLHFGGRKSPAIVKIERWKKMGG